MNSGRVLKIKEDKRVVVKTKENKRIVGNIKCIDSIHIEVGSKVIHLDSISFIKKRSIAGIFSRSISMYFGGSLFVAGIISIPIGVGAIVSIVVLPPSIPMLVYAISSNKRRSENWKFKIVFK